MIIEFEASNIEIKSSYYNTISCVADVNTDSVLDGFDVKTVVEHFSNNIDDLLSEIDSSVVSKHYGIELISHFKIDDVLEVYPIEDIIKHIGDEEFKNYIRDIYIDKVLK